MDSLLRDQSALRGTPKGHSKSSCVTSNNGSDCLQPVSCVEFVVNALSGITETILESEEHSTPEHLILLVGVELNMKVTVDSMLDHVGALEVPILTDLPNEDNNDVLHPLGPGGQVLDDSISCETIGIEPVLPIIETLGWITDEKECLGLLHIVGAVLYTFVSGNILSEKLFGNMLVQDDFLNTLWVVNNGSCRSSANEAFTNSSQRRFSATALRRALPIFSAVGMSSAAEANVSPSIFRMALGVFSTPSVKESTSTQLSVATFESIEMCELKL